MGIGNFLGLGSGVKPSVGAGGGMKPGQVLRKVDFSKEKRLRLQGVKSILPGGVINAKVITTAKKDITQRDGTVIEKGMKKIKREKLREGKIIDLMREKYIGKRKETIKRMIHDEHGIKIEDFNKKIEYKLEEKNRKIVDNIVTGLDGQSREEKAAEIEKRERFVGRNILGIQLDREKEKKDMASRLSHRREKGAKNAVDMRSGDKKVGATNIGVARSEYSVTAQAGSGGLNKASKPGFANKIENAEDKQGTAADLSNHKTKNINEFNDTPMFIPSADK